MTPEQKSRLVREIDSTLMKAMIASRDISQILTLARHYGHFFWYNLTDRWENTAIENHIFNLVAPALPKPEIPRTRTKVTHVITEAHDTGGHTPLCVGIIKEQKARGEDVELIITKRASAKVVKDLTDAGIPLKSFPDNNWPKLCALTEHLAHSKAVILHINPDDIVACLAAMFAERNDIPCYFVNHANVHFSYGPSQCSAILEITAASWLSSAKYRKPQAQSFLGIPATNIDDLSLGDVDLSGFEVEKPYFVSVGRRNKYRLDSSSDFLEFIEFLCGRHNQKLLMIGPGDMPEFQKLSAKARENLKVLGPTGRTETLALMANAAAYIDSFPEGGGTSVVNAMNLGLPLFGHRISEGMYGDEFLSPSLAHLFDAISGFLKNGADPVTLEQRADFIRTQMSISACVDRLQKTLDGETCPVPFDYSDFNLDLDSHQRAWAATPKLIVPSIINIGNNTPAR